MKLAAKTLFVVASLSISQLALAFVDIAYSESTSKWGIGFGASEQDAAASSLQACRQRSGANDCVIARRYSRRGYGAIVKTCDGHPCNHLIEADYANAKDAREYTRYLCRKRHPSSTCEIAEEWTDGHGLNAYERQATATLENKPAAAPIAVQNSAREADKDKPQAINPAGSQVASPQMQSKKTRNELATNSTTVTPFEANIEQYPPEGVKVILSHWGIRDGYFGPFKSDSPRKKSQIAYGMLRNAQNNHLVAQYLTGKLYLFGVGFAQNNDEAFRWLSLAANNNVGNAKGLLSVMHALGLGTPKNSDAAILLLKEGQKLGGNSIAYDLREHDEVMLSKYMDWIKSEITGGNGEPELVYTYEYLAGIFNRNDQFPRLEELANAGTVGAQHRLGHSFHRVHDRYKRKFWQTMAAKNGSVDSQLALWTDFDKDAEAFFWLNKAARSGNCYASLELGGMYAEGRGVNKNGAAAIEWLSLCPDFVYQDNPRVISGFLEIARKDLAVRKAEQIAAEKEKSRADWAASLRVNHSVRIPDGRLIGIVTSVRGDNISVKYAVCSRTIMEREQESVWVRDHTELEWVDRPTCIETTDVTMVFDRNTLIKP